MSGGLLACGWIALLALAIAACVLLHRAGLPSTYSRDLLHVGTGVWVLGWPAWEARLAPLAIVSGALAATVAVPMLATHSRTAARVQRAFTGGDERWAGLTLYVVAYAALTGLGLFHSAFPAAAALLALSLGDGLGGAFGRRFGRHHFNAPGGKRKSIEGSLVVAAAAAVGAGLAAWRFDAGVGPATCIAIGAVAAAAEAASPRGTDNLIVPATVWLLAETVS
jgi:dolichol kinase